MNIACSGRDNVYRFVKCSKNMVLISLKRGSKSKFNKLNGTNLLLWLGVPLSMAMLDTFCSGIGSVKEIHWENVVKSPSGFNTGCGQSCICIISAITCSTATATGTFWFRFPPCIKLQGTRLTSHTQKPELHIDGYGSGEGDGRLAWEGGGRG